MDATPWWQTWLLNEAEIRPICAVAELSEHWCLLKLNLCIAVVSARPLNSVTSPLLNWISKSLYKRYFGGEVIVQYSTQLSLDTAIRQESATLSHEGEASRDFIDAPTYAVPNKSYQCLFLKERDSCLKETESSITDSLIRENSVTKKIIHGFAWKPQFYDKIPITCVRSVTS